MNVSSRLILCSLLVVACAAARPAPAATVYLTGGDAVDGLLLDPALVIGAVNVNGLAQSMQGVSFAAHPGIFSITGGGFAGGISSFGGSPDDSALQAIASTGMFNIGGVSVTVGSLTPGETYQLDLLQSVTGNFATREQAILVNSVWQENVVLTNSSTSIAATTVTGVANGSGQIVMQFLPSAGFGGTGHQDGGLINGVVLSQLPPPAAELVPEPQTYTLGLFALAAVGLLAWRRRVGS